MKNFSKFEAFKLNKARMNEVNGGGVVSKEQYCRELVALANAHDENSWTPAEWDSWNNAFISNCG